MSWGSASYAQAGAAAPPSNPPAQAPAANQPTPEAPAAPSALQPSGYTYNPEGRRDPFVSLVRRGAESPGTAPAARPAGLAGLTAGEVSLRGTLKGRDGFVAMLQGADNKTYLVRAGDRLLDGTIRTITPDAVVILQRVSDPLSVETEREVRKVLRQTEEAK
jgi:type IV pilus assembly protein PilP